MLCNSQFTEVSEGHKKYPEKCDVTPPGPHRLALGPTSSPLFLSRYLWAMPMQWLPIKRAMDVGGRPKFWPSVGTFMKRAFQVKKDR